MSTEAPTWYTEQYKAGVLFKYQSEGHVLRGTYMPPAEISGKTMYFPIAGKGDAVEMKVGADLVPMNAGRSRVSVTTKAYQAAEYINAVDLGRMSANENAVAQKQCSDALGRRHDKIIIGSIHAGTSTYGTVQGSSVAAWDLSKALSAITAHFKKDIPEDGKSFCGIPQLAFSQMMTYTAFSNSQWVGGDLPFAAKRRAKYWAGVNWFPLPEDLFTALTASTVTSFYIWHYAAIGSGYNGQSLNSKITWENPKTAWLSNNWMDMGATVLLPEGITECVYKNDSAIVVA